MPGRDRPPGFVHGGEVELTFLCRKNVQLGWDRTITRRGEAEAMTLSVKRHAPVAGSR